MGRAPPAERGRVGSRRRADHLGSPGLGMDFDAVPAVSGLRARPVQGLFGAVVRRSSRAARRRVRDPRAPAPSALSQFFLAGTDRRLCRLSHRHGPGETMKKMLVAAALSLVAAATSAQVLRVSAIPDEAPTE